MSMDEILSRFKNFDNLTPLQRDVIFANLNQKFQDDPHNCIDATTGGTIDQVLFVLRTYPLKSISPLYYQPAHFCIRHYPYFSIFAPFRKGIIIFIRRFLDDNNEIIIDDEKEENHKPSLKEEMQQNVSINNVLSDHASPPSEKSQSGSSGTGDKDTPYLDRVRRNVLRLPEYKIREILANLKFQDTGLEPEDPDYEVKVQLISTVLINEDKEKQAKGAKRQAYKGFIPLSQIEHDVRMAWAEDRHKTKEKDNTVDQKESRQQELLSELKEIDKSIKRKRSPES
ncbi:MAG: hypothetical protein EZS28_003537, partial [Streblomastix strix]